MKTVTLKPGRADSLKRKHPWIFSGAIGSVQGNPAAGETVIVCDAGGKPLATGAYSPASQIRVRIWSFNIGEAINDEFFWHKLQQSIDRRHTLELGIHPDSACRLCYSESDGLPGLIVDTYTHTLVCQFLATGVEYWKETIARHLQELMPGKIIYERSDVRVRKKEGLALRSGVLSGSEPPATIVIEENAIKYHVDVRKGHKTGFYLDQRDNRFKIQQYATGKEVLNCFSYSGGFALAALAAGAKRVTNVDSSAVALAMVDDNIRINGMQASCNENIEANTFEKLREFRSQQRQFDIIVLDPPKFIDSKQAINRGARAYKDINMQAFSLLRPGGILLTFSCSGLLSTALMQKIVADAALDAGRHGRIIDRLSQSADHPVALNFPEAEYLKGFCVQVDQ